MDKKSSPAYTMSSKLKQTITKISIGPMTYQQKFQITKPSHPNAVIGKAPRQTIKTIQGPAPGQYNIQKAIRPKSSCAVFPRYKQPQLKQSLKNIGPGKYDPDFQKTQRKSVSVCKFNKSPKRSQNKVVLLEKTPGPMTYDPKIDKVHPHQPITKFGSSRRVDQTKLKASIPGPGNYNTQAIKTYRSESAFRFPQQKRDSQRKQKQKSPGPLDYKIEGQFESNIKHKKGFKIAFSRKQNKSMINLPGPTSYNSETKLNWKKAPAFSISHTERKTSLILNTQVPGPLSYNPQSLPKKRIGSAIIGSSKRQTQKQLEKKKAIPGPGFYQKAYEYKTIGSGVKFTIPRSKIEKQKQKQLQKKPGPWSYNPIEVLKQTIKFGTLGKSERQRKAKKLVPGPGDYDIKQNIKKGIIIGKQKRSKQKINQVPGPNAYTIPSTIGNAPYYQKSKSKISK